LFAVGHMALAYLFGKGSAKPLGVKINIPLLLVLAVLPDIDLAYGYFTNDYIHRGPTHSIVVAVLVFIPVFIVYGKRAIPYFLALISHSLVGDLFIGGEVQLFWPFSTMGFGINQVGPYLVDVNTTIDSVVEVSLFLAAAFVLLKSQDWKVFFNGDRTNLLLIIPAVTLFVPILGFQMDTPIYLGQPAMVIVHLFFFVLFSVAIIKTLTTSKNQKNNK
jgi:membrane-bound metal-dependent hydrolase YbcI (DUF457 family)